MQAVVALSKIKRHFAGVMKTSHGLFPKAFLQESLSTAPARSRVHLNTIVEGVQLVATCYKYNRRKVLFLHYRGGRHSRRQPLHSSLGRRQRQHRYPYYLSTPCSVQLLRAQSSGRQPQPLTTTRAHDGGGLANPRLLVPTSDYLGRYLRYRVLETRQVSRLRFPPLISLDYQGLC
jgi:hypothetical protein